MYSGCGDFSGHFGDPWKTFQLSSHSSQFSNGESVSHKVVCFWHRSNCQYFFLLRLAFVDTSCRTVVSLREVSIICIFWYGRTSGLQYLPNDVENSAMDYFVNKINPSRDLKLLDVAGGTGDIAFRFLDRGANC